MLPIPGVHDPLHRISIVRIWCRHDEEGAREAGIGRSTPHDLQSVLSTKVPMHFSVHPLPRQCRRRKGLQFPPLPADPLDPAPEDLLDPFQLHVHGSEHNEASIGFHQDPERAVLRSRIELI
jgi:hypothetical protein